MRPQAYTLPDRPCLACLRLVGGMTPGQPAICSECWPKLTVMERSRLVADERTLATLSAILAMLQGNRETDELTAAADKIERSARQQAESMADIRTIVVGFVKWFQDRMESEGEETEGGEEWRRSLKEDEDRPE